MLSKALQEVIEKTRENPHIDWIDPEWAHNRTGFAAFIYRREQ